ncbi:MAG: hypothetical protein PHV82_08565 [Victivallaceae bacterium]|nr:hypothetical protein [Victivallaceae bacterium]
MKNSGFAAVAAVLLTTLLAGCKAPPEQPLVDSFQSRRKAVSAQAVNLAGDIGDVYTDEAAVRKYLDSFIRKNPQVAEVALASVPLARFPFSVTLAQMKRAEPAPAYKYDPRHDFNYSDDMIWYRKLLKEKNAFWYRPSPSPKSGEIISYIYPVCNRVNPAVMLYILKLDYDREDNPVLFWNVVRKFYDQELLKQEEKQIWEYSQLKKAAEQQQQDAELARQFEEADTDYKQKCKELENAAEKRLQFLEKQQNRSRKIEP